eukprot:scaffold406731_cov14-Prasinocladus_malaysianus.AAC.1
MLAITLQTSAVRVGPRTQDLPGSSLVWVNRCKCETTQPSVFGLINVVTEKKSSNQQPKA